jgi:hypothetical protein
MNFELRPDGIDTLRNRLQVGVSWSFRSDLDADGERVLYEGNEMPEALAYWNTRTDVYAQGPTSNDWAPIGWIAPGEMEGATTYPELHAAAERVVRAELERVGFETGPTVFTIDRDSGDEIGKTVVGLIL